MKFALIALLIGSFVYSTAHIAHVQITADAVAQTIQPGFSAAALLQHLVG